MRSSIEYVFEFAHAPERVWALLVDPVAMAKWLMPNDFAPKLGHRFTFRREPIPQLQFDGIAHCEVIALDPPKHLAFTFAGGPLETVVSFRLEPCDKGTRMHFEHSGFDLDDPRQQFSFRAMGGGWEQLGKTIEGLLGAATLPHE